MVLQMAIKAVNDLARPNGIIPILLVFRAYLWLIETDPLLLSVAMRAEAIYIATKEVCRLYAERHIREALIMHNRLDTKITLDLPL